MSDNEKCGMYKCSMCGKLFEEYYIREYADGDLLIVCKDCGKKFFEGVLK